MVTKTDKLVKGRFLQAELSLRFRVKGSGLWGRTSLRMIGEVFCSLSASYRWNQLL